MRAWSILNACCRYSLRRLCFSRPSSRRAASRHSTAPFAILLRLLARLDVAKGHSSRQRANSPETPRKLAKNANCPTTVALPPLAPTNVKSPARRRNPHRRSPLSDLLQGTTNRLDQRFSIKIQLTHWVTLFPGDSVCRAS